MIMYKHKKWSVRSVIVVELQRIGAAGGRDHIVFAPVEQHLAVVVGRVPDDDGDEAEPGVGPASMSARAGQPPSYNCPGPHRIL
jgi:hypothetical protein